MDSRSIGLDLDQNEKGWRFRYLVTTPSHGSSRDRIATELMLSGASFLLFGGFMNFCLVLGFWGCVCVCGDDCLG
jgi:hypothetical protein